MNTYVLGAVKPNVKQAANDAGNQYGIRIIYGVGQRDGVSDHPKGLALDFMVPNDSSKGDQVAQYFFTNANKYGVKYIIWKQRIWSVERQTEGWRAMGDRGGITANHFDHVHVSFNNVSFNGDASENAGGNAGASPILNLPGQADDTIRDLAKVFAFISNPANVKRVAMFQVGVGLLALGVLLLVFQQPSVKDLIKQGSKVAKKATQARGK